MSLAANLVPTRLAVLEGEIARLETQCTREEIDFQREHNEAKEKFSAWDRRNKARRQRLLVLIREMEALRNV